MKILNLLLPVLLLTLPAFGLREGVTLSAQSQFDAGYQELVELNDSFRSFAAGGAGHRDVRSPVVVDGVPDYSPAAMDERLRTVMDYQRRLAAIDTTAWDAVSQIEYLLVLSEMKAAEFQHRWKPWTKDPAFYDVITSQWSTSMDPSMRIPSLPISREDQEGVRRQLAAIPVILDQARRNLTDPIADLAFLAIRAKEGQTDRLRGFIAGLREHHPDLVPPAEEALRAIEGFRDWLQHEMPGMRDGAGVGIDNYNWYLEHVALLPYTWEELVALVQREYERAVTKMLLMRHRYRYAPPLNPVQTEEEYLARVNPAREHLHRFTQQSELFTVPDYLGPLRPATGWSRGEQRDYFQNVLDRYPLPLIVHEHLGHTQDFLRRDRDHRPIRGQPRLFHVDGIRAEAVATGLERFLYHLGLVDHVPGAAEVSYNLKAFRAARGLADLRMHSNELTLHEAYQHMVDTTPYGWVVHDSPLIWGELQLYLRQPTYGVGYVIGPLQIEKLLAQTFLERGDDFDLTGFMDELLEYHWTHVSLISLDILGRTQHQRTPRITTPTTVH